MQILVTGSSGLIGFEAASSFDARGYEGVGVDGNVREVFYRSKGGTSWNTRRLLDAPERFRHAVVHADAPSHGRAPTIPLLDFEVNAESRERRLRVAA